ncbi:MAG: hypothetical protein AB8H86_09455 [Polyangiales bacterium]
MSTTTIDLRLSGPEGSWITRALSDAGMEVIESEEGEAPDADVLIIDRNHAELEKITTGYSGVLIIVGWDPLTPTDLERLEPHSFYERPVPIARLLRTIREALGLESPAVVPTLTAPAPKDDETPNAPEARELTVQLSDSEDILSAIVRVDPEPSPPPMRTGEASHSSTGALDAPEGAGPRFESEGLQLSPHLNELLRAADRRLFPGQSPLDLRFPVGEEDAHQLVPDELLAEVALPLDVQNAADPLEAFTFVGTPDLLDTAAGRRAPKDATPHTVSGSVRPPMSLVSSTGSELTSPSVATDLTKEGMLPAGGALRMFWQLRQTRGTELRLEVAGGVSVTFSIKRGRVAEMRGPANSRVAEALRNEGLLGAMTHTEEEAQAALDDAVKAGRLSAFERDARLRVERELIIGELCRAHESRFVLTEANITATKRLFARPLIVIATERVRAELGAGDALRWLGIKPASTLWLAPNFVEMSNAVELPPELAAAFEAAAGRPVVELLSSVAATAGAAGALFSLASAEALRFEAGQKATANADSLRSRIERAHALALEGDYFDILGISRNATSRQVKEAHQLLIKALTHLDLESLGLEDLEGPRDEAVEAIEDAFEVLRHERLRKLYIAGLAS